MTPVVRVVHRLLRWHVDCTCGTSTKRVRWLSAIAVAEGHARAHVPHDAPTSRVTDGSVTITSFRMAGDEW